MNLRTPQQPDMTLCYTIFHHNQSRNTDSTGGSSYVVLSKVLLSLRFDTCNPTTELRHSPMPDFTQTGQ